MKKFISLLCAFMLSVCFCLGTIDFTSYAANKNYVVVIDPGHGGVGDRNLGAIYNGFTEKELTLQVAVAMKAELEKYEGVTVYLTRTADEIKSLESRADFAKSVNADFVFSIHFNASSEHLYYGSEVWTSAFGSYYQKGQAFGLIESDQLANLGLYQKGVKTKIGSSGNDYYGIIRHCVARGIPCDIIEHCYLDHAYDVQYLKGQDFIQTLGIADATAVAKYFKLKSSVNVNDFSNISYKTVKKPSGKVWQDSTDPDTCSIKVLAYDSASRNALVEMTTKDSQSPIIYFAYSYDGGKTFSPLQMWDRTQKTQSFNVNIPGSFTSSNIVCRAYNNYELFKQSNEVAIETR
jgi:N-acetylmuramoyl-L-alanine amidase